MLLNQTAAFVARLRLAETWHKIMPFYRVSGL
jgi:hypothetical protein